MANKRLSPDQINDLQKMVVKGVYPDDIAKHFNIAVSSIHNYKKRFKEMGLDFPSIKGKKPSDALMPQDVVNHEVKMDKTIKTHEDAPVNGNHIKFIINGIEVIISSGAKSINISDHLLEVRF